MAGRERATHCRGGTESVATKSSYAQRQEALVLRYYVTSDVGFKSDLLCLRHPDRIGATLWGMGQ